MIPVRRVMREKRGIVMPLFIALLVNVALYAVAVYPLARTTASEEARAAAARTSRNTAARDAAAARATVEGKDRADRELRKFYAEVLPPDQASARRMTYLRLSRLAREAGLELGRASFTQEPVRDSALTELRTVLDLEGEYRAIRRFVFLLESAPEFTIIENVTLTSSEEGTLQLSLDLATYFRTEVDGD